MMLSDTINKPKVKPAKDPVRNTDKPKKPHEPKRRKKNESFLQTLRNDERIPKALGLICLLTSVFLFIAFASYLFTWQTDQDKVIHFTWGNFLNGKFSTENYLGRFGAF